MELVHHRSYTIQVDPESSTFPFGWFPWLAVATPILAVTFVAALLFWAKRRSRRRP